MEIDLATRELLKIALLPPGILLILLLLAWMTARKFFGRFVLLLTILFMYALSTPIGVNWLAMQLETIPALTPTELRTSGADAIWVPLAGVREDNPELGGNDWLNAMSLERMDHALHLHRKTKLPILVSGGNVRTGVTPVADLAAEWLQTRTGIRPLAVENTSRDTWENAHHSIEHLREHNAERVLLVTHAYHMPRAVLSARAAGIEVVPAPFGFLHRSPELRAAPGYRDWMPLPAYLGYSYLILHEMAGLIWYGLAR